MSGNTLDDLGRATLEAIDEGRADVEDLASALDAPREECEDRLAQLLDNGLVRAVDGRYEVTENGERLLEATPAGARDDRIDTPAHVERRIDAFDCRPDEAAAVRGAFSFLQYWGDATTAEIVDATYSEEPAGYDDPDRWWADCVRDRLEALPDVRLESEGRPGERWTYDGEATIERSGQDGRAAPDPDDAPPAVGSARHALESQDLESTERRAARIAFATLSARGRVRTVELLERTGDLADSDGWPSRLRDVLEAIPSVERLSTDDGEEEWQYSPLDDGETGR